MPAKSIAELIALAKEKPGTLSYGTAGLGTAPHMGALLFESMAGLKLTPMHYRGASPALNDVIAGHINMITMGPSIALPTVKAGKLNMLGFGSLQARCRSFPTCRPSPRPCRATTRAYRSGCSRPRERPPDIVAKINADVQQIIDDPDFRAQFLEPQVVQPLPGSLEAFGAYLQAEAAKWSKVIGEAKIADRMSGAHTMTLRLPALALARMPCGSSGGDRRRPFRTGPSPSSCRPRRAASAT